MLDRRHRPCLPGLKPLKESIQMDKARKSGERRAAAAEAAETKVR
jgi:hypothetical protein